MRKIISISTTLIICYIAYSIIPWSSLLFNSHFYSYFGAILSILLNVIGTSRGMLSISSTCAGTSFFFPNITSKSIIGIIICETNLLCGIIMAYLIMNSVPKDTLDFLPSSHALFSAGLITGSAGYASSMATGLICAAVNITDAKDPKLFPKLVFFEFVAGSVGVLGLAIGFLMKEKSKSFL